MDTIANNAIRDPMLQAWQSDEFVMVTDTLRVVALLTLIAVLTWKLAAMQRYTRVWDGLSRAVRAETIMLIVLWVWILLRGLIPGLDHPAIFVVMATLLIAITARVAWHLPSVRLTSARESWPVEQEQQ